MSTYSERWLAYVTGTRQKNGNDPHVVAEHWRKMGIPTEEQWPSKGCPTLDDFYTPPPAKTYQQAQDWLTAWELGHDTVQADPDVMKHALRYSPLGMSVRLEYIDGEQRYSKTSDLPDNHWIMVYGFVDGDHWKIFDSAPPYHKKLAWNVSPMLIKRYVVSKKNTEQIQLGLISQAIKLIQQWVAILLAQKQAPQAHISPVEPPKPVTSTSTPPKPPMPPVNEYKWDTTTASRHSVRVICDEMGLTLAEKNIITACIQQESQFNNKAVGRNRDANGNITSTDWGICQINDHYHVGPGKKFPSVKYILDNPDKCVKWMIQMYKQGKLNLWVSYSSGAYKTWLPK